MFNEHIFIYYVITTIIFILWIYMIWKTKQKNLFAYGFVIMYVCFSLSPFYYLSLTLMPFMFWDAPEKIRRYTLWATCILIIVHLPFIATGYITFGYYEHLESAILFFLFVLSIMGVWIKEELFTQKKQTIESN